MMSTRWWDCFQGDDRTTHLPSTEECSSAILFQDAAEAGFNGRDVPHDENERYFWLISHGY